MAPKHLSKSKAKRTPPTVLQPPPSTDSPAPQTPTPPIPPTPSQPAQRPPRRDSLDTIIFSDYYGDVRAWNAAWEEQNARVFAPGSKVLLSEQTAQQQSRHLDEFMFNQRRKGWDSLGESAWNIFEAVGFCTPDSELVYERWRGKTLEEREEIVLAALAGLHSGDSKLDKKREINRRSAPEITLEGMAGGGGQGFVRLVNAVLPGEKSSYSIVCNSAFERVYGFRADGDESLAPLSKRLRAWQDEELLVRASYLQGFVSRALELITGKTVHATFEASGVATPANSPILAAGGCFEGMTLEEFNSILKPHVPTLKCECCYLTESVAKDSGSSRNLQYCSKCLKIGRKVAYCSAAGQKKEYLLHKEFCGKAISETLPLPLHTDFPTSPLNPFLLRQVQCLWLDKQAM